MGQHEVFAANTIANASREAALQGIRYQERTRQNEAERLAQCLKDFAELDHRAIHLKTDKELAEFQSSFPLEAPQYALALNEWNRRLVTRQVKATRFSAYVGLIGIVIGSVMGWILASYSFKQSHQQFIDYVSSAQMQDQARQQADKNLQGKNPDHVPPKTTSEPSTE